MKKGIAIFLAAAVALLCPFCVSFAATDISDQKSTVTVSVPDNTVILTRQTLGITGRFFIRSAKRPTICALFLTKDMFFMPLQRMKNIY